MVETIDKKNNLYRHEYKVKDLEACRSCIQKSEYLKNTYKGNKVIRYIADLKGSNIDIRSFPNRLVMFCKDRNAMFEFVDTAQSELWT